MYSFDVYFFICGINRQCSEVDTHFLDWEPIMFLMQHIEYVAHRVYDQLRAVQ